jgi:Flp pilus assembly protein TadG
MRLNKARRPGATTVEAAVVYPVMFLLILGLIVGGLGIFRYQETASLARETARYAIVHGTRYAKDAAATTPAPADIYSAVIQPKAVALDPNSLSYAITYNTSNNPFHTVVDANGNVVPVYNTVTVTVSYYWIPEVFLGGVTLTSTSCMQMSY